MGKTAENVSGLAGWQTWEPVESFSGSLKFLREVGSKVISEEEGEKRKYELVLSENKRVNEWAGGAYYESGSIKSPFKG